MQQKIKRLIAFFKDWNNQSKYMKWMVAKTRPFIGSLLLLLVFDICLSLLGVGSAVINKRIIDAATSSGDIKSGLILLVALTAFSIGVAALISLISTLVHEKYAFGIRSKVYNNVIRSNWQQIAAYHSGDLITRLTSDIDGVANGIADVIPNFIMMFVRLTSAFFVLYYYDSTLALIALLLGPVGVILSLSFSGKLKKLQEKLKDSESRYHSFMQESIANILVVKSFQQEDANNEKLKALRDERLSLIVKRNRLSTLINVLIRVVFNAGYVIAFSWGAYRLHNSSITYGTMTVFLSLVSQVQGPIMGLAQMIPQFVNILASTGRVMEIDELTTELQIREDIMPKVVGLKMQGVTFAYDNEEPVLQDVQLDIVPGDIVGIVGYSGAGKTTLIRLAMALTRPLGNGLIQYYDTNGLHEIATATARRFIAYVPQGNSLLSGTIADNMRIGKRNATEDEMWAALALACADDFVRQLPDGLNTIIREKAGGLSEGQAQRISIARALIRNAPFLILDEATSALDADTEATVLSRLYHSGKLNTCLVITHRQSMLRYCTRAVEIAHGKVQEFDITKEQGA